jgi:transposase-like protein
LTRRLVERALEVELTNHLGYESHREPPGGAGNTRNGRSQPKMLKTDQWRAGPRAIGMKALSRGW